MGGFEDVLVVFVDLDGVGGSDVVELLWCL